MCFRLLLILILVNVTAATSQTITGHVIDAETGEAIPYAHVIIKGTEDGTITNLDGYFRLDVSELPVLLVVSEVAHESKFYRAISDSVVIEMQSFSLELEGITVIDRGEPYFKMAGEVLDFEFYDDFILVLGNSGREVRLLDHRGNIVDISPTPGKFREIFKDCLDNLHLVADDTTYQVFYDFENIRFIHPHPTYLFDLYLRNCRGRFEGGLIYSLSRRRGLINSFLFAAGGNTMPFYEIGDTSALNYLESNYDLNFFIEQRKTNGRYHMSVGELENNLEQLQDDLVVDWFDSRILDPGDYFVFSYPNKLRILSTGIMTEFTFTNLAKPPTKSLVKIDDSHLSYLTIDESTKGIYAVYKSGMGKVWAVDLDEPSKRLNIPEYAFPSGVRVRDSYMFFVVDPAIDGSNHLMRKNLKFGESVERF